jgi:uncharacterized membrane protein YccC
MNSTDSSRASGIQYAVRILLGTTVVWLILRKLHTDPIWAMISVVIVSGPRFESAVLAFKSRVTNTVIGCGVGLSFLLLFGLRNWSILIAMTASVLVCTYLVKVPVSWRIAPVTVAIVMTPGLAGHSKDVAIHAAFLRTGEVLLGSGVAVAVAWTINRVGELVRVLKTGLEA